MSSQPENRPERADVETSSDGYAARFAGHAGAWMLGVQERIALHLLAAAGVRTVLDVGGGHGQLAGPLARSGYEVTVLGSAASCARRVQHLVDARQCTFVQGDVVNLPFPDRSFDAVISVRLVMHCDEWPDLIAELCRVARRTVVVDYPLAGGVQALAPRLFAAKRSLEKNTRTWRPFRHAELVDVFARHGYRPAGRRGQFFLPMVIHRALKQPLLSRLLEALPTALGLRCALGSPVIARFDRA